MGGVVLTDDAVRRVKNALDVIREERRLLAEALHTGEEADLVQKARAAYEDAEKWRRAQRELLADLGILEEESVQRRLSVLHDGGTP